MISHEARKGTIVRVREGHWNRQLTGMIGTVQKCWGDSDFAAVDVKLDDGRLELFWLPELSVLDEDAAA